MTGHKEYLIKGYYVRAFRFLLKPVLFAELKEALMSAIKEGVSKRFLFVESYGVHLKINVRDIMYIESVCNGCKIYTINMVYELGWSLKKVMEQLNVMEFYQISRKYIASLYHIKKLELYQITMDDSKLLEVTRRRKKGLETARAEFIHKR